MSREIGWSEEQIAYLKINWLKLSKAEMAAHLGKAEKTISNRASKLGLPPRQSGSYGRAPWNKGLSSKPEPAPTVDLAAARARMKQKPGPMTLGYRYRSWRQ